MSSLIDLENYRVKGVVASAYYVREWVSTAEERSLLAGVYAAPRPKWTQLSGRRVQSWGGTPHARGMVAERLPPWLGDVLTRLPVGGPPSPNHVLVNEYRAGQGILAHEDGPLFHPAVITLSLGSHAVLRLWTRDEPDAPTSGGREPAGALLLEPRSLVVLRDSLYTDHLHSIEEVTSDVLDDSICNLGLCSENLVKGSTINRDTRISLTIRWACSRLENVRAYSSAGAGAGGGECAVVGVYGCPGSFELTDAARELDQQGDGKLSRALNEAGGRLRPGRAVVVSEPGGGLAVAALAALGPKDAEYDALEHLDFKRENVRVAVGAGVRALRGAGGGSCCALRVDPAQAPDAAAEAATLAVWCFQEYKSCAEREPEPSVSLLGAGSAECAAGASEWEAGLVYGRAQNWARYLSDMPANHMTPADLAQAALDVLCPLGVKVEARDRDWIETQRMEAFLMVARGSCEAPMFLECTYDGPGAAAAGAPVLLAAKGVTFDSGGLCLKPAPRMRENRGSMAGAAVALAALRIIAELKLPVRVRLVAPLCENMVSGQCMKVGDVVRALNGLSIQIEDTDMEGRLMLADALVYGQARFRPGLVVDVATLTHGVLLATGGGAFGAFTNAEGAWAALRDAGAHTGDRPWRFPLWHYYHQKLTNELAVDLRNKGSSKATPCLGAAFLRNFVCGDWVHMDITGVGKLAHAPAPPYLDPRRMTGRPARTLARFLAAYTASPATPAAAASASDNKQIKPI